MRLVTMAFCLTLLSSLWLSPALQVSLRVGHHHCHSTTTIPVSSLPFPFSSFLPLPSPSPSFPFNKQCRMKITEQTKITTNLPLYPFSLTSSNPPRPLLTLSNLPHLIRPAPSALY
ncbi:hypothetical protein HOY80DRAFT_978260 [Tuber brumale]|nr:hypothetical protein HOY80DRAFT_978260 [Tuber brumale]